MSFDSIAPISPSQGQPIHSRISCYERGSAVYLVRSMCSSKGCTFPASRSIQGLYRKLFCGVLLRSVDSDGCANLVHLMLRRKANPKKRLSGPFKRKKDITKYEALQAARSYHTVQASTLDLLSSDCTLSEAGIQACCDSEGEIDVVNHLKVNVVIRKCASRLRVSLDRRKIRITGVFKHMRL